MKESIYTIPLNDLFSEKCGCPLCRLDGMIRKRYTEFIMGPAMMSPEIRIETNKKGFCPEHYRELLKCNNKLSLALMTQTRLETLTDAIDARRPNLKKLKELTSGCYLCEKEEASRKQIYNNILSTFRKERDFRESFSEQEYLCLPHYIKLLEEASVLSKSDRTVFSEAAYTLFMKGEKEVKRKVDHFSFMFDYRNQSEDADWGDAREALLDADVFLNKE